MLRLNKTLFSILFACGVSTSLISSEVEHPLQSLLSNPSHISHEEIAQKPRKMLGSWISTGRASTFYFADDRAYLRIEYWGDLPDELSPFADQFQIEKRQTLDQQSFNAYVFEYGDHALYEFINPTRLCFPVAFNGTNYVWSPVGEFAFREPRCLNMESQTPTQITAMELHDLIDQNKVVFFTGTGFGKISGVPSRGDLEKMLGMDRQLTVDEMVKRTIADPEGVISVIREVCQAMYDSEPTNAHYSLAAFAQSKPCQVLCDNDDYILEKTGLKAVKLYGEGAKLEHRISLESLKEIELLICLGLEKDNKGILSLFKELNPHGKILSVDLKQPKYLGRDDLFLQGDLKEVFCIVDN